MFPSASARLFGSILDVTNEKRMQRPKIDCIYRMQYILVRNVRRNLNRLFLRAHGRG